MIHEKLTFPKPGIAFEVQWRKQLSLFLFPPNCCSDTYPTHFPELSWVFILWLLFLGETFSFASRTERTRTQWSADQKSKSHWINKSRWIVTIGASADKIRVVIMSIYWSVWGKARRQKSEACAYISSFYAFYCNVQFHWEMQVSKMRETWLEYHAPTFERVFC